MKRKITALLMSMTLLTSTVGFAAEFTPKEMLKESSLKALEIKSCEQDIKMNFGIDLGEHVDESLASFEELMKDVDLDIHSKTSTEDSLKAEMTLTAALSGMTYTAELYMNNKEIAMKIPMVEPYVVQEYNTDDIDFAIYNTEEVMEFSKKLNGMVFDLIKDDEVVLEKDIIVNVNERNVKVNNIKVNLTSARAKQIAVNYVNELMNDEYLKSIMVSSIKQQSELNTLELTDEEILAELDITDELVKAWTEISRYMYVDQCEMTFSIDESSQLVASNVKVGLIVHDPNTKQTSKVKFDIDTSTYNINNVKDIEFPELNENNSITSEELAYIGN